MNNSLRLILALAIITTLNACSSSGPVELKLQGDANPLLNRDSSGKSLSLVLHIYQLKSVEEFNRLTFDTVSSGKTPTELLGNALVTHSEFVLLPGKSNTLPITLQAETQFVGVVGFFRKPDAQFWRALISGQALRDSKELTIKAQDCYLQIIKPKTQLIPGQPATLKADCGISPAKTNTRNK
ncbi:type VI secretion system lipoprotein TssJ [uncultured Deefgea sp.]|uniref:type VI secretion system lipoprotein TssJ n=1 Tax=uncultured Deefgea sp. TaxID=1304914 RepID=UPI00261A14E2|nr:type VI secretion system lipoprotein TssJ [uncultured Deefgea sp.]